MGVGGKIEPGETLLAGALREIKQEVPGMKIIEESLVMRALLEVRQGDEHLLIHTMAGYVKDHLTPWASKEFDHFGWWDRELLPTPMPADAAYWLPRALHLDTPPMSVKVTGSDIVIAPDLHLAAPGYLQQKL